MNKRNDDRVLSQEDILRYAKEIAECLKIWGLDRRVSRKVGQALIGVIDKAPTWVNPLEGTNLVAAPGEGGIRTVNSAPPEESGAMTNEGAALREVPQSLRSRLLDSSSAGDIAAFLNGKDEPK